MMHGYHPYIDSENWNSSSFLFSWSFFIHFHCWCNHTAHASIFSLNAVEWKSTIFGVILGITSFGVESTPRVVWITLLRVDSTDLRVDFHSKTKRVDFTFREFYFFEFEIYTKVFRKTTKCCMLVLFICINKPNSQNGGHWEKLVLCKNQNSLLI